MNVHDYFNTAEQTLEDLYSEIIKLTSYPSVPARMIKDALRKVYEARAEVIKQRGGK